VADHHLLVVLADEPGERSADIGDELLVEFLTHQATNVIRLDDAMNSCGRPGHTTP
jgi:hypothetical protein